jgi:hypothetical protein
MREDGVAIFTLSQALCPAPQLAHRVDRPTLRAQFLLLVELALCLQCDNSVFTLYNILGILVPFVFLSL